MDGILRTLKNNAREQEERETQRLREELALKLEPYLRGYLVRKKYRAELKWVFSVISSIILIKIDGNRGNLKNSEKNLE